VRTGGTSDKFLCSNAHRFSAFQPPEKLMFRPSSVKRDARKAGRVLPWLCWIFDRFGLRNEVGIGPRGARSGFFMPDSPAPRRAARRCTDRTPAPRSTAAVPNTSGTTESGATVDSGLRMVFGSVAGTSYLHHVFRGITRSSTLSDQCILTHAQQGELDAAQLRTAASLGVRLKAQRLSASESRIPGPSMTFACSK
jgi:hypothetical protein